MSKPLSRICRYFFFVITWESGIPACRQKKDRAGLLITAFQDDGSHWIIKGGAGKSNHSQKQLLLSLGFQ